MNATQNSQPTAGAGGQNPGGNRILTGFEGIGALAQVIGQVEPAAAEPTEEVQPQAPAEEAPETAADSLEQGGNAGQESSPGETDPQAAPEGDGGESQPTDLSQSDALSGLDEATQTHLLELAQAIKDGKLKPGELPRINTLVKQRHEVEESTQAQIAELQQQIEALKQPKAESQPASAPETALPTDVAKLNSVAEVAKKRAELTNLISECIENADGYTGADGTEVPAARVRQIHAQAVKALNALPVREQQLQQQQWVKGEQAKVEQQVRKLAPEFYDAATTLGQRFKFLASDPLIASLPNRDFTAAALALGEQQLLQRAKPPTKVAAKPAAAVPKAKPPQGGSGAAPANPAARTVRLTQGQVGDVKSLADFVASSGR